MLFHVDSSKSIEEVCAGMEPVVQKHKFGVMTVHNLKETMAKKGVPFDRDCYIFEICNPHQAKKVLESKMEASTLPVSLLLPRYFSSWHSKPNVGIKKVACSYR